MSRFIKWGAALVTLLWLAGCATTQPLESRDLHYRADTEQTFREAVAMMIEQGYVVRHADMSLGRAEAVLARWPGYRLQLQVSEAGGGTLVRVSALSGSQPIPPYVLDPWLVELQSRLGELP
ncbi:hypothetical protein [Halomonas sp. C22]|uniref:hypothetical protein n=1 Tax=Halomonas sp. C22 TaxID=2580567 RepID=UPI0011A17A0A|nr:hypothetical protein [Halomonas sp. C22]